MYFRLHRNGALDLDMRDRDGEEHSTLSIDRVRVGKREYVAKAVSLRYSDKFLDVVYPNSREDEIIPSFFRGYLGVELAPGFYLPSSNLFGEILAGSPVSVRYRVVNYKHERCRRTGCSKQDGPRFGTWSPIWKRLSTTGIAQAAASCARALSSDAAFKLGNRKR